MDKKLNINKIVKTVISLNIIQMIGIAVLVLYNILTNGVLIKTPTQIGTLLVYIIILSVFINNFFTIRDGYLLTRYSERYDTIKDSLNQVENLNKTLRVQRHDFMNHLQVVYSLIEMDEYKESKDYIERVYNDIQKVNRFLKTSHPAVNALLQAKVLYGEARGIVTVLKINSQLLELKMPAWEFCRVLGNIIDNAIYALREKSGDRLIEIEIFEDIKCYGFRVANNGPVIPHPIIERIFESGFTTKGENGQGMGLAITKELLTQYGGDIRVESSEHITAFEGMIPR